MILYRILHHIFLANILPCVPAYHQSCSSLLSTQIYQQPALQCNPGKCVWAVTMAATIARTSDPSAIADTMPTTKMSSDDAADGSKTAAVGDALPSILRLRFSRKCANSGTAVNNVATAAALVPHTRPSRVRNPLLKYPTTLWKGLHL